MTAGPLAYAAADQTLEALTLPAAGKTVAAMTRPASRPFPRPTDLLPGADFGDRYALTVDSQNLDAAEGSRRVFGHAPPWIKGLLGLRNMMTRPFGLKPGRDRTAPATPQIGIFPVIRQSPGEVVMGLNDRHLDFRVSLEVRDLGAGRQDISVSTAVRTHNLFGRSYLAIVKPFHRLIVPTMLRQAAFDPERSREIAAP